MPLESERELWDRIEAETGISLFAHLGTGLQGSVYLAEDLSTVAKITHSKLEAATAAYLASKPHPFLPAVTSVHSLTVRGEERFLIVRENLDDIVAVIDEDDEALERDCQNAFIITKHPEFVSDEILASKARIESEQPDIINGFRAVMDGIERFNICSGIEVSDIHFRNIGKRPDDSFVLRDFGMSSMPDAACDLLLTKLSRIPDGENTHIRKPWR
jgi:hypothetical protein